MAEYGEFSHIKHEATTAEAGCRQGENDIALGLVKLEWAHSTVHAYTVYIKAESLQRSAMEKNQRPQ